MVLTILRLYWIGQYEQLESKKWNWFFQFDLAPGIICVVKRCTHTHVANCGACIDANEGAYSRRGSVILIRRALFVQPHDLSQAHIGHLRAKYRPQGSYRSGPPAICIRACITTRWQYSSQYTCCRRDGQGEPDEHPIRRTGPNRKSLQTNRVASLRLTERCEGILISIRDEISLTGGTVTEELYEPIAKLFKCVPAALTDRHTHHLIFY